VARLLILLPTSTYRAPDFMDAARAVGAEVVVGSDRRQALAGSMGDRAVVVDLGDPGAAVEAIAELHARQPLDGIVAVDDQGVVAAALAAERIGLAHNSPASVAATRDKAAMRALLGAASVPQPRFAVIGPDDDPGGVGYPAVLKPLALSGSRGVIRANSRDEAVAAAARIRAMLAADGGGSQLLAEELLAGPEVAVEGMLRASELEVLAVFDKPDPLEGPFFEETIYVTPSRLGPAVAGSVAEVTARACAALGLKEGPVHAELRITPEGPKVIEVAARSIGGLCARTLRFGAGVSLEELIVRHALGLPTGDLRREAAAAGVMMLPIPRSGTLVGVAGVESARQVEGIVDVVVTIPRGRPVVALPEGDRYLGFLFARGATPVAVESALRAAHGALFVSVDPF